jgi:hypothetical protein
MPGVHLRIPAHPPASSAWASAGKMRRHVRNRKFLVRAEFSVEREAAEIIAVRTAAQADREVRVLRTTEIVNHGLHRDIGHQLHWDSAY